MPAPVAPRPNFTVEQVCELTRLATLAEPTTSPTLVIGPLRLHTLVTEVPGADYPRWRITGRGQRWLASWEAYRAARAAQTAKVTYVQLGALRAVARGHRHVGAQRTLAAVYERGLIDWALVERDSRTAWGWALTDRGRQILDSMATVQL